MLVASNTIQILVIPPLLDMGDRVQEPLCHTGGPLIQTTITSPTHAQVRIHAFLWEDSCLSFGVVRVTSRSSYWHARF